MVPSNSSYLSSASIFHFHDCGRKGSWFESPSSFLLHFGKLQNPEPFDVSNIMVVFQATESTLFFVPEMATKFEVQKTLGLQHLG